MTIQTINLQDWVGRRESRTDLVTAFPVAALSATLNRPAELPVAGTPIPAVWHWLYFLPLYQQSEAGPDGHPQRGGFMPPIELPRRMWAGSQIDFSQTLAVGDQIRRDSSIISINEKSGRTGHLIFVKVRHQIYRNDDSQASIDECHDIVYRAAASADDRPVSPVAAPTQALWERPIHGDELMLFRYSALTFNGHRIHYDRSYVTAVEGYPGLVVHGPLIATLLLDGLRHQFPTATVTHFEFKAIRPTFDINPFSVCGAALIDAEHPDGKTFRLWAKDHQGWLTMDAKAVIR
jgi:3-methylfumaryl-CoA hydratase